MALVFGLSLAAAAAYSWWLYSQRLPRVNDDDDPFAGEELSSSVSKMPTALLVRTKEVNNHIKWELLELGAVLLDIYSHTKIYVLRYDTEVFCKLYKNQERLGIVDIRADHATFHPTQ